MRPPGDFGFFSRITLKGEIDIRLPAGHAFSLSLVEFTAPGGFLTPSRPLEVEVRGSLGELRKLSETDPHLEAFLEVVKEESDLARGVLRLHASHDLMADLAASLAGVTEEPAPDFLINHAPWLNHALSFGRYVPDEVGVVVEETA